ncbi:unnamed protein product [Rotaria sordida]|uniref:General transcription and DNA repair factor IIH subunit TFB5 n=1 Tax=Rotaria sordida TaxID=392033 RepID=A0A820CMB0_9BILA|nr:unnamed protein product [Rotaria sordida]
MVNVVKGALIKCDPAVKQYLVYLDKTLAFGEKFILHNLDEQHLFVQTSALKQNKKTKRMSHEEFISNIYSRLSKIISSDPLLSDIKCHPSKISFSKLNQLKQEQFINISIRRFDNSIINIYISEEARVYQLKRAIKEKFSNKNIHWKTVWKRYTLATHDHQQLINDNRRIKYYGVYNNSELFFIRRRRLK